jgi:hypothetical protein
MKNTTIKLIRTPKYNLTLLKEVLIAIIVIMKDIS